MPPIGIKELLVILVIVGLIFGTKKLRTLGSDVGSAVRGFRKAMNEDDEKKAALVQKDEAATETESVREADKTT